MRNSNLKGFGTVYVLLLTVVIGCIGAVGYYVWNLNTNDTPEIAQNNDEQQQVDFVYNDVTIPEDWENYTNNEYEFSYKYPSKLKVTEVSYTENENDDKTIFSSFASYQDAYGYYSVSILKTTLDAAVTYKMDSFNGNTYKDTVKTEYITKDGLNGVKISYEPEGDKVNYFFFQGTDVVYRFESVDEYKASNVDTNEAESKAIFNSLNFR